MMNYKESKVSSTMCFCLIPCALHHFKLSSVIISLEKKHSLCPKKRNSIMITASRIIEKFFPVYNMNALVSSFLAQISVAVGTLLLICLLANPAASSAPSDAHQRCIQSADRPIYEEGEKVLMDSRHYEYLIGQSEAVWDRADFDTNNNGNSFTYQTEVRQLI